MLQPLQRYDRINNVFVAAANLCLLSLHAAGTVTACPDMAAPVCGTDGLTYWNECLAKLAKVAVQKKGYCEGGWHVHMGLDVCWGGLLLV